jgi:hypothetical protein
MAGLSAVSPLLVQRVSASQYSGGSSSNQRGGSSYTAPLTLPEFEIYDLQDNPANGKLVRVNYRERGLSMTVYPQLGPRKTDPKDPSPQFDFARRSLVRFRPTEIAAFLAVIEGKLPSYHFQTKGHDLIFSPLPVESEGYSLKGTITRNGAESVTWDLAMTKTHVTMFYRFLDSALVESFGFDVLKNPEYMAKQANQK